MKTSLPVILLAVILCLLIAPARQLPARQADEANQYALSSGAAILLSSDWTQRALTHIPPPAALAPSAPPLDFYDFLVFQNAADHSQVEFALSTNPFLGRDAYSLDGEMHRAPATGAGMVSYLFFFFFPPPPNCLNGASSAYDKASRDAASKSDSGSLPNVTISFDCQYAPSLSDFYSFLVSGSLTFRQESRVGVLRDLYLLPMVTEEFHGLTFYVFEAQGRKSISLAATDRFNLPDSLQGTQPDFLWAIGAPSPFPFVQDVTRKKASLLHVVYAGVAPGANKKDDFLRILRTVQIPRP